MNLEEAQTYRKQILACGTWQQAVLSASVGIEDEKTVFECDGRTVSYGEYKSVSDCVAAVLACRKIGPGMTVALRMKRSEKMFPALFGVAKSGAALLPIPQDLPEKRAASIYQQVHVDFTINDEEYEKILQEYDGSNCEPPVAQPDDPALILFTSGSTGTPKGVVYNQKGMLYSAVGFPIGVERIGMSCSGFDTVLAKTNLNFMSAFLFEIPMAAFYGKKIVVLTEAEQNSFRAVGKKIEENPKACIFLTPSQVESYLKEASFAEQFRNLSILILAGEPLAAAVRDEILSRADPTLRLVNVYGATECQLLTCRDEKQNETKSALVMPDTDLILVDENGSEVTEGEPGEIAVSSPHQLDHYLGEKMRTAEKNGVSYFCTGDLGVRHPDGTISLRGRIDRMVKFHGMRVELGGIEQTVCLFSGIAECAVVVSHTEKGTEILTAFCVSDDGKPVDVAGLKAFLKDYLPVNLIPAGFVQLDSIPLNENGKRNYKELAGRTFAWDRAQNNGGKPENSENLALLCRIVSEVTGERASPQDNLFYLGMDSLMAFRIISRLSGYGLSVSLDEIFSNPILCNLAAVLKKKEAGSAEAEKATGTYTATGIQIYWGTNVDVQKKLYGLYVTEDFLSSKVFTQEEFHARVRLLLKKHPALRSHVSFEGYMPMQTISDMDEVCVVSSTDAAAPCQSKNIFCLVDYEDIRPMHDEKSGPYELSEAQKEHIDNYKKTLMDRLVSSEQVFALQAAYFRLSDGAGAVVLTGNHASIDGTSMNILVQELISPDLDDAEDCYCQFLEYIGRKENMARAIAFYAGYLPGADFSALPRAQIEGTENMQPPLFKGVTIPLGKAGTDRLYAESRQQGVSPIGSLIFMYGQALLKTLQKDALIMQILTFGRGVPVEGMDRAVGCFIEYIPVVIRKEDTTGSFQKGYLKAEQNSFAPLPVIWKQTFGLDQPPKLAPFLISEVFPPIETDGVFRKLSELDYEKMVMSSFITQKDGEIILYFHYNAAETDENSFLQVTDTMQEFLKESGAAANENNR